MKIILIIVIGLLVVLCLAALVAPSVAKKYVNRNGETLIGRPVDVQSLHANLLTGRVRLYGLTVYEAQQDKPFLHIDTLDTRVALLKLLGRKLEVKHLTVADLSIAVIQEGSRFNFSDIIDHFASDSSASDDTSKNGQPWALGFYNIRLSHWHVYYSDRLRGSEWKLRDLNLEIPGVYMSGERSTDAGLSLAFADGGLLSTKLNYNMQSNDFSVSLQLQRFDLNNIKAYLTDAMNVSRTQGWLDADLNATGNVSELLAMHIRGTAEVDSLALHDADGDALLQVASIAVKVNDVKLDANRYDIDYVHIRGLDSHFDRDQAGNNFGRFFDVAHEQSQPTTDDSEVEPTPTDSETAAASKPMTLIVANVVVEGQLAYNDLTLPDPFHFPLTNLRLEAHDVNLQGSNSATLQATLPHGGAVDARWSGRLDDMKTFQHLVFNVKSLKLADVSPMSVAYLGYPFTNGIFSFTSDNRIENSAIVGRNVVDMYRPEVGPRRTDVDSALRIPMKTALYVLKDKDDKVNIELPVSGNLDDPKFSYMRAVWKTLGNLLVKVAASPARALGRTLGIGGSQNDFIPVAADQTELTSQQYAALEELKRITDYDPSIRLTLVQQVDSRSEDYILELAETRNRQVKEHLLRIGIPEAQLEVRTADSLEAVRQTGYAIESAIVTTEE